MKPIVLFFETHPVFHFDEFAQFMQSQGSQSVSNWRQLLNYHHKTGRLVHVRKLLYAVKPMSTAEEAYWVDPYSVAGKVSQDAVIGYHTALELHNMAYTTFEELTFFTAQAIKPFIYQDQRFRPVSFPQALMAQNQQYTHTECIERQGIKINVTNLERTIVDILDRPHLSGGWEEIWRSFDHVVNIDIEKLIHYTLMLNNATTVSKVGYFLEQRPAYLKVDEHYLHELLPHIPKQKHYLNRSKREKGQYIEKWRLIVPFEISERRWEEKLDII